MNGVQDGPLGTARGVLSPGRLGLPGRGQVLRGRWCGVAAAGMAAVLLAGCGAPTGPAPRAIASRFTQAVAEQDGAEACALLAPATRAELEESAGTSCATAVVQEDLPEAGAMERSSTFGTMAQVTFTSEVLFLAEFPRGWRVLAAGCAPGTSPEKPYECRLSGG